VSTELKRLAAELESVLLTRMLRDMREAGRWDDESDTSGLGAAAFFEAFDTELARQLTSTKGLGLASQLEAALGANAPTENPAPTEDAPASPLKFAVPSASITSNYGWRSDPITGAGKFHRGIDIRAAYGDEIQAAGGGRVVFSGEQGGYGTTVIIEHAGGVRTRYAHLSAAIVKEGDTVSPGQPVGRAGRSGRATGTHLHFEVTVDGKHVPPSEWGLTPPSSRTDGD
jgi:murein DD-endopeptidase MepM/ murein hydrolase activator NlpD